MTDIVSNFADAALGIVLASILSCVLDGIWDLIELLSEGFLTYSCVS